jgi:hypothetical protein
MVTGNRGSVSFTAPTPVEDILNNTGTPSTANLPDRARETALVADKRVGRHLRGPAHEPKEANTVQTQDVAGIAAIPSADLVEKQTLSDIARRTVFVADKTAGGPSTGPAAEPEGASVEQTVDNAGVPASGISATAFADLMDRQTLPGKSGIEGSTCIFPNRLEGQILPSKARIETSTDAGEVEASPASRTGAG